MIDQRVSAQMEVALLALARHCHARGWSTATSGNFSVRIAENRFLITSSGIDKGSLGAEHLLLVDGDGNALEPGIPSAETLLHAQIYRRRPHVFCVVHTHSVAATMISRLCADEGHLVLSGFEIAKALTGIDSHETTVRLPIFANDQNMTRLAAHIDAEIGSDRAIHGYLLAGHGLYTWGKDVTEARRHLEALEFLLDCGLYSCFSPMMGRG